MSRPLAALAALALAAAPATARVQGREVGHQRTTFEAFEIDSAVGIVVDDNALQALVPALPLAEGASWRLTMFSAGRNLLVPMTLAVTGRAEVEVPAGRFDAWRVEAAGAESVIAFAVSAAAPRRVLRVEVVGSPLEFVLVQ